MHRNNGKRSDARMTIRKNMYVTIFDGTDMYTVINLADYGKDIVSFGRSREDNDIVLNSTLVSKQHGCFQYQDSAWTMTDHQSTNGIFWNGHRIDHKKLANGDRLLIGYESTQNKVALIFSTESPRNMYKKMDLRGQHIVIIGRDISSDIVVNHVAAYKQHCKITVASDGCYIEKIAAGAVIQYNGGDVPSRKKLSDMDRFMIGDVQFIYQNQSLYYIQIAGGLSFDVNHVSKIVGKNRKRKKINDDITFTVEAGEFVAIIGGSGAGKSTLLNCLCGCSTISEGKVFINGESLTENYNSLKNLIGYVPQQDIVYDNLTLKNMLFYTAKLRMPPDSTDEEIESRIKSAMELVELSDKGDVLIRSLSGGQKKRASIAVELLADPKLFFLDEPTSGLDPGTERNLMMTMKAMTKQGKTVVLVTHTPLNLHLCDKIVILGRGGKLCYCGTPGEAPQYFGVNELVDIYEIINNTPEPWAERYIANLSRAVTYTHAPNPAPIENDKAKNKTSMLRQLKYLIIRYLDLMRHDAKRIAIQLGMAPGLGLLLFLAFSNSYPFEASYDTQKLALTFACCAFWIGLFNSIQEICKEKQIYRRERMANLKLLPYVASKLIVNAVLDMLQTILMIAVVWLTLGMPEKGMQLENFPALEITITTYLTMLSATCMGFLVSAIVENSDQSISIAPILLIPQILFSGAIIELEGMVEKVSYLFSCRYACVAYCTTSDLNNLPSVLVDTEAGLQEGAPVLINNMYFYDYYTENDALLHLLNPVSVGWMALTGLCLVTVIAAIAVLKLKTNKK